MRTAAFSSVALACCISTTTKEVSGFNYHGGLRSSGTSLVSATIKQRHDSTNTSNREDVIVMEAKHNNKDDIFDTVGKSLTVMLTTFAATTQVTLATMIMPPTCNDIGATTTVSIPQQQEIRQIVSSSASASTNMISAGAPSFGGGAAFETLDFSMPSYDGSSSSSSIGGGLKIPELKLPGSDKNNEETKEAAPAAAVEDTSAADKAKAEAEEKAAKKVKEAEDKKAKEAEEKAKKAADEEAKAAAKAKRLADQKAKQEEAVKRAAEAKAAKEQTSSSDESSSAPVVELPKIELPTEMPKMPDMPKFEKPDLPKFEAPKFEAPKFEAPKFEAPKFEAPKFEAPKFDAPKFDAPKFDTPKFDAPKFDVPKFDAPKFDTPKVSLPPPPKLSIPDEKTYDDPDLEPQEVRDERARNAKTTFKGLDQDAKEIETLAKAARAKADAAKKEAKILKAEACKTRPGGKLICLRPFGIGY